MSQQRSRKGVVVNSRTGWTHSSGVKDSGDRFAYIKEIDEAQKAFYRRKYGSRPPPISSTEVGVFSILPPSARIR